MYNNKYNNNETGVLKASSLDDLGDQHTEKVFFEDTFFLEIWFAEFLRDNVILE